MIVPVRRLTISVIAALIAVLAVEVAATAGQAAEPEYVALGDSYASGLGTREYYEASGDCRRSPHAHPVAVAAGLDAALTFKACADATVADVTAQLGALDRGVDYVSVQVGGNDAGFKRVLIECAKPAWAQDCKGAVRQARAIIAEQLPERLTRLYAAIDQRSPAASVVVVGYPRIFSDEDCNAGTWFSAGDRDLLNETADILNRRIAVQAAAAGFSYVNPTSAFLGHAVCDSPEWVNGLSHPVSESYHPNRAGQDAYARLVAAHLD